MRADTKPLKRNCINEQLQACVGTVFMSPVRDEQWFKENIRCCWSAALMHFGNNPPQIWAGAKAGAK